jgi:hypothetical protein
MQIKRVNSVDGQSTLFYRIPGSSIQINPAKKYISAQTRFRHYLHLD